MKAASLLFLAISWAPWMPGTGCAAASNQRSPQTSPQNAANTASDHPLDAARATTTDDAKRQKKGTTADQKLVRDHDSAKNRPRNRASLASANRPRPVSNNRKHPTSRNAVNLHPPGLAKSDGARKNGLVQNETGNDARRVPRVSRSTAPSLNNVRHHGPNPAVIGGSASSNGRNAGAIDGARIHRKP
ncbi:MAG: hypothetical protein WB795_24005 [Candidatus Acidiferrales bacterium]